MQYEEQSYNIRAKCKIFLFNLNLLLKHSLTETFKVLYILLRDPEVFFLVK